MGDEPRIEALDDHEFVLHLQDPEGGAVEIHLYASPDVLARLGVLNRPDEHQVVEATTAYLLARQRADELPPFIELDDVAAAYGQYMRDLKDLLARGDCREVSEPLAE